MVIIPNIPIFKTVLQAISFHGGISMSDKQQTRMQSQKKKFSTLINSLEQEYKTNLLTYRTKYLELADALNGLYKDIKKNHYAIVNENQTQKEKQKDNKCNVDTKGSQMESQGDQFVAKEEEEEYEPMGLVEYFRIFGNNAEEFCRQFRKREVQVKQEIGKLFGIDATSHFLEALAKKNLENFDLSLKVQELTKALEFKALQLRIATKTTQQYQRKFKVCQNDFNIVVISISDMLKDCQKTETELRQQNRLQKQVFQSHKIQFERFKADFKYKPSLQQKANRVRQVLEKKYMDRQEILLKQAEKIMENKFKNSLNQSTVKSFRKDKENMSKVYQ